MRTPVFINSLLSAGALLAVYPVRRLAVPGAPGDDGWIGWVVP